MVIAIELLAAARALDLRGDTSTPMLEEARSRFRCGSGMARGLRTFCVDGRGCQVFGG